MCPSRSHLARKSRSKMGRKKSTKAKEKKLKWREDLKKLTATQQLVDEANKCSNHLESLAAFQKFNRNGLELTIECKKVVNMSEEDLNIAFDLTKRNMESLYRASSWGWNDKDKRNELSEDTAWYLFARDAENRVVAISHFRFDVDEDDEVLYCYEIQLEKDVRGKGLGKFLIQILELICFKAKMKKLMVTVFKENDEAMKFFTKLKYIVDETSPRYYDPLHPEDYDYEILSKALKKNEQ